MLIMSIRKIYTYFYFVINSLNGCSITPVFLRNQACKNEYSLAKWGRNETGEAHFFLLQTQTFKPTYKINCKSQLAYT